MIAPTLRSAAGAPHAALLGLGAYRPSRVVPNAEVVDAIRSTEEWIEQRSGIRSRRWATEEESLASMAVASAHDALSRSSLDPRQVDCVVVATVTHLEQTPALATEVAHELGTEGAAAFDISAACAGFCHGIALAADMVRGGSARHVLVIGAERLSDLTDPADRGTAFLFADGAGAVVVGQSESPGIGPVAWGSDGAQAELIRQKQGWRDVLAGPDPRMPYLTMQGQAVFRWASFEMAKIAREALDRSGVTVEDLDLFVPHQANRRITEAMARSLRLPDHVRVAHDIADQGNTSAASIPLALDRMVVDGEASSGDLALLIAFGAGLAYAAQVVKVP
jgi:3-oxoacyl-[acyl-carrier-protein] synthase III